MPPPVNLPAVGRYQVLSRIGAGGMAEVYDAQTASGERFALKAMRASLRSDPKFVEMFLNEARIAALLEHPNIVRTVEVNQTGGVPFIAMERVDGATLREILDRKPQRPVPAAVAARIMAGVAAALHHGHAVAVSESGERLQVIHRDVSPQNVMVDRDGRVILLDLGVAKAQGARGFLKSSGDLLKGKVRYMAPELLETGVASPATDLFAAGALLFELISGEMLYGGTTDAEVLLQAAAAKRRPVLEVAPACPVRLVQLIDWALAVNPAERPATAGEWSAALEAFAAGEAGSAADVAAWARRALPPLAATWSEEEITVTSSGPPPASPEVVVSGETRVLARASAAKRRENPMRLTCLSLTFLVVLVAGVALGEMDPSTMLVVRAAAVSPAARVNPFAVYLDGAEAAMAQGHFDSARESIELARQVGSSDARLNIRMTELASRAETGSGEARVRSLIKVGDLQEAQNALRKLAGEAADAALLDSLSSELSAAAQARTAASARG